MNTRIPVSGSALPATIAILALLSMLGINAIQSATLEAQFTGSLADAQNAFSLASYGIDQTLLTVMQDPDQLPEPIEGAITQLPTVTVPDIGITTTMIRFMGQDIHCPALDPATGERLHYEITSIGAANSAKNQQIQGIALCRELCSATNCIGTEQPATRTYWAVAEQ
jgi:hypothetical protein